MAAIQARLPNSFMAIAIVLATTDVTRACIQLAVIRTPFAFSPKVQLRAVAGDELISDRSG
jgi:hypothetical protein